MKEYMLVQDIGLNKQGETFLYGNGIAVDTCNEIQSIDCMIDKVGIENEKWFEFIN